MLWGMRPMAFRDRNSIALALLYHLNWIAWPTAAIVNPFDPSFYASGCGTDCLVCAPGLLACQACYAGFGLDAAGNCRPCAAAGCTTCYSDFQACTACGNGTGLAPSSSGSGFATCEPCSDPGCSACSLNHTLCSKCNPGLGPDPATGGCLPCPPSCELCRSGSSSCDTCAFPLLPDAGGGCAKTSSNCETMEAGGGVSGSGRCAVCAGAFGLRHEDGACVRCAGRGCYNCGQDYRVCRDCGMPGFGLAANGSCLPCTLPNCGDCGADYLTCVRGEPGYGLVVESPTPDLAPASTPPPGLTQGSGGGTTGAPPRPCADPWCLDCGANYAKCEVCDPYANLLKDGTCRPCKLKAVSYTFEGMNSLSYDPPVNLSASCARPRWTDASPLLQVQPDGTLSGACGREAPYPLTTSSPLWPNITADVLDALQAYTPEQHRALRLCPRGAVPLSLALGRALALCGTSKFTRGLYHWAVFDAWTELLVDCPAAAGPTSVNATDTTAVNTTNMATNDTNATSDTVVTNATGAASSGAAPTDTVAAAAAAAPTKSVVLRATVEVHALATPALLKSALKSAVVTLTLPAPTPPVHVDPPGAFVVWPASVPPPPVHVDPPGAFLVQPSPKP